MVTVAEVSFSKGKINLIETAERLFAERGLDGVSLNEITVASGQRNASAINYHFGSRRGLIEAIVLYRMQAIEEQRRKMLEEIEASGRTSDLRALMEARIRPIGATLAPGHPAGHYVRFLMQIYASPNFGLVDVWMPELGSTALHALRRYIAQCLPHLPKSAMQARNRISMAISVISLGDVQRQQERAAAEGRSYDLDAAISNIIDMQVGALAAPIG